MNKPKGRHGEIFSRSLNSYVIDDQQVTPLVGDVGEVARWVRSRDIARLSELLERLVASPRIELTHPLKGTPTRARASKRIGKVNLIFFSDEAGSNRWILVQHLNFADGIITPSSIVSLVPRHTATIRNRLNEWLALRVDQDALFHEANSFDGVLVAHRTPYHFFYDFLKNLLPLVETLQKCNKRIYFDPPQYFFPLAGIAGSTEVREASDNRGVVLWPLTIQQNDLNALGQTYKESVPFDPDGSFAPASSKGKFVSARMRAMESSIREAHHAGTPGLLQALSSLVGRFVLWVGVSDLKRSWLEQVEGYAHIISSLSQRYADLVVIFDGITAPAGACIPCISEKANVVNIIEKVPPQVTCHNLVGEDYSTKVMFCRHVSAFISDAGTASMVPLRFCRKPGVLYSNGAICSFPDTYEQPVELLDQRLVSTVSGAARDQYANFSIDWRDILDALNRVISRSVRIDV